MKFINAHGVEYVPDEWLTFDDITLMPMPSSIASRNDASLSLRTNLTAEISINSPLVSANMDTVTEGDMAIAMGKAGGCGILHRFYHPKYEDSYSRFINDVNRILESGVQVAFSVGLSPNDLKIVEDVVNLCKPKNHLPVVCVDVAKGDQERVAHHIRKMKLTFGDQISIIGGNVCTTVGAQMLIQAGVSAIKVGVGPGCFLGNTLIETQSGLKQIKDVTAQDWVKTHMGTYQQILGGRKRTHQENLVEVNGNVCTPDHLFYAIKVEHENQINDDNIHDFAEWIPARLLCDKYLIISTT